MTQPVSPNHSMLTNAHILQEAHRRFCFTSAVDKKTGGTLLVRNPITEVRPEQLYAVAQEHPEFKGLDRIFSNGTAGNDYKLLKKSSRDPFPIHRVTCNDLLAQLRQAESLSAEPSFTIAASP